MLSTMLALNPVSASGLAVSASSAIARALRHAEFVVQTPLCPAVEWTERAADTTITVSLVSLNFCIYKS
ncbi:unnamed protein product [Protopolystoma xenopodis]|uniref:Uncharacterized protein n=1 Tax=Protopolystoma xenopodis TaxID=117903 RepID=A0A448WVU6_9PLAT|nr:unnamed protein product [Protopolystoma xenopodis]